MKNKRTERIVIRTTPDEHRALAEKAKAAGVTVSTLVRGHLDRMRVYNHADREAWLRGLAALQGATAAMARAAAALKTADAAAALAYLAAIHRGLRDIMSHLPTHARKVLPPRDRRS